MKRPRPSAVERRQQQALAHVRSYADKQRSVSSSVGESSEGHKEDEDQQRQKQATFYLKKAAHGGGCYSKLPFELLRSNLVSVNTLKEWQDPQHKLLSLFRSVVGPAATQEEVEDVWERKVKSKQVHLYNPQPPSNVLHERRQKRLTEKKNKKRKLIRAKQRREKKLEFVSKENIKYQNFLPLHTLWKQYAQSLGYNSQNFAAKLLKADLHGCLIKVTRSKCPTLVGIEGIIVVETEHTFQIVTKQDQLKVIPKQNSVFTFLIGSYVITLFGNHIMYRSSERSARKFKYKPSIEL
jgi:ribonuclease P protein subunit POP4